MIRRSVQALTAYTPGEQPRDPDVIKLNTNENPYPPTPRVAAVLAGWDPAALRRYPDPVSTALRDRIAALHGCRRDRVFVANGSDEVLALCTRAFVENDGAIGYFEPSYSLYPVLADIRAVDKRPIALDAAFAWPVDAAGAWTLPADYACALFFFTNPNAPTSLLCPAAAVRAFCERSAGVVVLDEAYVDFAREDNMALALDRDNVLVARSLSKSYALAGLRVGYAVGAPPLVRALDAIKDSYNLGALAQALACAAVEDHSAMRANVARIVATRERLVRGLAALGYRVLPSETNFVWARPGRLSAQEVFDGLRARRILVRFFDGPRTRAFLRITVGTDDQVDALLAALAAIEQEDRT
jgi:histidinol-phosphate aminotransferase